MTATPERIVDIAIGFMGAKQLEAASRIGLFRALSGGPLGLADLARTTGHSERQVRTLADAMNALGLLERKDGQYSLAEDAAAYLAGSGAIDLAPFLSFLGDISYRQWLGYNETVSSDQPGTLELDEAGWAEFLDGVMVYNALHAEQLGRAFDFTGFRSALDFGGLAAGFSLEAMRANPELTTRFVYDESMVDGISEAAAAAGVADRVTVEVAATETAKPGGEHDLLLLTHVLHRFDAEQNRAILAAARGAAESGATLLLLDFFLDRGERQRAIDALHAGEYFNIDGTIVYPIAEVEEWLAGSGWRAERLLELPGSPRVIVATAV